MTDIQKQYLLAYLGYYRAGADGIWGPASRQATLDFQAAYMDRQDGVFDAATQERILEVIAAGEEPKKGGFWAQIRFFTREEFRCTCGGRGCNGFPAEPRERLIRNAEAARLHFGAVADVSSGVRCDLRNAELPGSAANSLHKRGKAMDFRIRGVPAEALLAYVKQLPGVEEAYAIDSQFVHMGVEKHEGGSI